MVWDSAKGRWASSAGPLLVRTVWLGSHHHAVLTKDDPAARGPPTRHQPRRQRDDAKNGRKAFKKRAKTNNVSQSKYQSQTANFDSFSDLTDSTSGTTTPSADSGLTASSEGASSKETRPYSAHQSRAMAPAPRTLPAQRPKTGAPGGGDQAARRLQTRTRSCLKHQMSCPGYSGVGGTNGQGDAANNGVTDDNQKDPLSNMLSDRVLQWLDLAGRIDGALPCHVSAASANQQQGAQGRAPRKRVASVQLYNIRIRNQTLLQADAAAALANSAAANAAAEPKKTDSTRSRKGSAVMGDSIEVPKSIGCIADIVNAIDPQVAAVLSRVASAASGDCKKQQPAAPLMKTTGGGGNGKAKSKVPAVLSRSGAYEKAVERQHVERACNAQVARKQLHIFMPSLPGRRVMTSGDNESCLSTIPSELSQIQN